jgi:hypothetical protein
MAACSRSRAVSSPNTATKASPSQPSQTKLPPHDPLSTGAGRGKPSSQPPQSQPSRPPTPANRQATHTQILSPNSERSETASHDQTASRSSARCRSEGTDPELLRLYRKRQVPTRRRRLRAILERAVTQGSPRRRPQTSPSPHSPDPSPRTRPRRDHPTRCGPRAAAHAGALGGASPSQKMLCRTHRAGAVPPGLSSGSELVAPLCPEGGHRAGVPSGSIVDRGGSMIQQGQVFKLQARCADGSSCGPTGIALQAATRRGCRWAGSAARLRRRGRFRTSWPDSSPIAVRRR